MQANDTVVHDDEIKDRIVNVADIAHRKDMAAEVEAVHVPVELVSLVAANVDDYMVSSTTRTIFIPHRPLSTKLRKPMTGRGSWA